ncbi:type 1 glutamine amidotransferase domain-containing protein [Billgrantia azerbaijanica]|nr:type 1 glutamine amidotransferase domain-containing protein [Halomonas azerbaijanica]
MNAATTTRSGTATRPVLMVLTSHGELGNTGRSTGFFLGELTHPLAVFEEAGLPVELASPQGGEPPVDGLDLDDPVNARYWNDPAFRDALSTTQPLEALDASRYSALFFAGGHGTMWDFPDNPTLQRLTREAWEAGAVVGAVCHGPSALVNVRLTNGRYLVEGREVSAFTDAEERAVELDGVVPFLLASRLAERGAIHRAAENFAEQVTVSGRLVTGQNPASARGVGEAMLAQLREARGGGS